MKKQIVTLNGKTIGECTSNISCYNHNNEHEDMRCNGCCYLEVETKSNSPMSLPEYMWKQ